MTLAFTSCVHQTVTLREKPAVSQPKNQNDQDTSTETTPTPSEPATIKKPEANWRTELSLKSTIMGVLPLPTLYFGMAKLNYEFLRLGGGIAFTPKSTVIDHDVKLYEVSNGCLCFTADIEWDMGNKDRILTGGYLGIGVFTYSQIELVPEFYETKPKSEGDAYYYAAPRVRYLRGDRNGVQYGFGVYRHHYEKLDKPELVANHPAPWGIELTLAVVTGAD